MVCCFFMAFATQQKKEKKKKLGKTQSNNSDWNSDSNSNFESRTGTFGGLSTGCPCLYIARAARPPQSLVCWPVFLCPVSLYARYYITQLAVVLCLDADWPWIQGSGSGSGSEFWVPGSGPGPISVYVWPRRVLPLGANAHKMVVFCHFQGPGTPDPSILSLGVVCGLRRNKGMGCGRGCGSDGRRERDCCCCKFNRFGTLSVVV